MDTKELAAMINGREYMNELSKEEERRAKESGLVVVFGYSDDCLEFRGAVRDELGAYGGTTVSLAGDGSILQNKCEDEDCPYFAKLKEQSASHITARWAYEEKSCSWFIETNLPHETFDIMEDGELFCRGIVYRLGHTKTKCDQNATDK